jgi:hypothetical protein
VKSFAPAAGLSFCFLVFLLLAGVPGGEASGLDLFEMGRALFPMVTIMLDLQTFILVLGICIPWGKLRDSIGICPFQNMIFHVVEELCNVFHNLLDAGNDEL